MIDAFYFILIRRARNNKKWEENGEIMVLLAKTAFADDY